jgi:DNA processing protein
VTLRERAEAARPKAEALGGRLLLPGDPAYPPALMQIPSPPTHLFVQGDTRLLARPAVAIVGTRHPTRYGQDVCAAIAAGAAAAGLVVVSGMARGLDAVAHRAALEAGGGSIGVLGNGLGVVYPESNRRLYGAMADRGLLVTEFLPGERPVKGSFQRRNRLISALARVTVVVEAGAQSGTLITAGTAADQGRDVLVVPGPITSPVSVGTNRLLRDGAAPFLELRDLLEHFPECAAPAAPAGAGEDDASLVSRILALLAAEAKPVDAIAAALGVPAATTLSLLALLEIQGLVRQEPGMVYRRGVTAFAATPPPA